MSKLYSRPRLLQYLSILNWVQQLAILNISIHFGSSYNQWWHSNVLRRSSLKMIAIPRMKHVDIKLYAVKYQYLIIIKHKKSIASEKTFRRMTEKRIKTLKFWVNLEFQGVMNGSVLFCKGFANLTFCFRKGLCEPLRTLSLTSLLIMTIFVLFCI